MSIQEVVARMDKEEADLIASEIAVQVWYDSDSDWADGLDAGAIKCVWDEYKRLKYDNQLYRELLHIDKTENPFVMGYISEEEAK